MRGRVLRRNEKQKDRSAARKRESKGIVKIRSVNKLARRAREMWPRKEKGKRRAREMLPRKEKGKRRAREMGAEDANTLC